MRINARRSDASSIHTPRIDISHCTQSSPPALHTAWVISTRKQPLVANKGHLADNYRRSAAERWMNVQQQTVFNVSCDFLLTFYSQWARNTLETFVEPWSGTLRQNKIEHPTLAPRRTRPSGFLLHIRLRASECQPGKLDIWRERSKLVGASLKIRGCPWSFRQLFRSLAFYVVRWIGGNYRLRQQAVRPLPFILTVIGRARPLNSDIPSTARKVGLDFNRFCDRERAVVASILQLQQPPSSSMTSF